MLGSEPTRSEGRGVEEGGGLERGVEGAKEDKEVGKDREDNTCVRVLS